eukprot:5584379-Pyramimonas_sp.AAC.1
MCTRPTTDELWNTTATLLVNKAKDLISKPTPAEELKSDLEHQRSRTLERRKLLKGTLTGRETASWQDTELELARLTFRIRS